MSEIKENSTEITILDVNTLDKNVLAVKEVNEKNFPVLATLRERQEKLVADNPFVNIENNEDWDKAKKHRTALRTGRTDIQKKTRALKSEVNARAKSFIAMVEEQAEELIAITQGAEDDQQAAIDIYENKKKAEKEAKAEAERIEREKKAEAERIRINGHKDTLNRFKLEIKALIGTITLDNVDSIITQIRNTELNVEEFEDEFYQLRADLLSDAKIKRSQLEADERIRIENEKLERKSHLINLGCSFDDGKFNFGIYYIDENDIYQESSEDFNRRIKNIKEELQKVAAEKKAENERLAAEKKRIEDEAAAKAEADRLENERLDKIGNERFALLQAINVTTIPSNVCATMPDIAWDAFYKSEQDKYSAEQKRIKDEADKKAKAEKDAADKAKKVFAERALVLLATGYDRDEKSGVFTFGSISFNEQDIKSCTDEQFKEELLPSLKDKYKNEVKRLDAIKPEQERLLAYINTLQSTEKPELVLEQSKLILNELEDELNTVLNKYYSQIKSMK